MSKINELIELLKGHVVHIQTHNYPDPDAFGSAFGLQYFLKQYGIESDIVYDGFINQDLIKDMIKMTGIVATNVSEYDSLNEEDYVITVDGQRDNSNFTNIVGDEVACIDHHPWTTDYVYKFVDHRIYGACSSIVTSYFNESGIVPPTNVATALLYGIKTDTNDFTRGVQEEDIEAYHYLYKYADEDILRSLAQSALSLTDLHVYAEAFQNVKIYDGIGISHINIDCPDILVAMVSDFILSLKAVKVAVVYAKKNGGLKFSVRSELPEVNAGTITREALEGIGSGGGHAAMAGGFIPPENLYMLEDDPEYAIKKRFVGVI